MATPALSRMYFLLPAEGKKKEARDHCLNYFKPIF
jgi:hypothetical protein